MGVTGILATGVGVGVSAGAGIESGVGEAVGTGLAVLVGVAICDASGWVQDASRIRPNEKDNHGHLVPMDGV